MTITVPCSGCCKNHDECTSSVGFTLTAVSLNGTGCLCGFSEYTDPSDPPRKYKKQTYSGTAVSEVGCSSPTGTITCIIEGECVYDVTTCTRTSTFKQTCNGVVVSSGGCGDIVATCGRSVAITQTTRTATAVPSDCCSDTRSISDSGVEALEDEDTPLDALSRGTSTPGTSTKAFISVFDPATFCFSGQTSHWTVVFTGLNPLCTYRFTIIYAQGSADGTRFLVENVDFTSSDGTFTIEGDVPAVVGYETDIYSTTVTSI